MPSRQGLPPLLSAAIAACLPAVSIVLALPASGAVPPSTAQERIAAIAAPSMMYMESWVSGYLRRTDTGQAINTSPIVLTYRCSGFIVSSKGHVATSSHCLQPGKASYRGSAAAIFAGERVKSGQLAADQRDAYIKDVVATTEFTGDNLVSAASVKVYGQVFMGEGSLKTEPAMYGEIVDYQSPSEGDVTLVTFGLENAPAVEISPEALQPNASVVAMGFVQATNSAPVTYTIRSQTAVTARYGTSTPQQFQMDSDLGPIARGGMVADSSGRFIGLVNADLAAKDRPNRLITSVEHIKKLLSDNGVTSSLSPADQAYRAGLDAYFSGRYSEAIEKFDSVIAAAPGHATAARHRAQAADRFAIEGDANDSSAWWLIVLVVLAMLAGAAVIVGLVAWRRKAGRQSGQDRFGHLPSAPPISPMTAPGGHLGYQTLPAPQLLTYDPRLNDPDQPLDYGFETPYDEWPPPKANP